MAQYSDLTKPDQDGHQNDIADLKLEEWTQPAAWKGDHISPDDWPQAGVRSLIQLFNGSNTPDERYVFEIPDQLGWHIAFLIETWSAAEWSISTENTLTSLESMMEFLEESSSYENRSLAEKTADHEFDLFRIERNRSIVQVVQNWYTTGIALYQATC